ncbi:YusW family protein [Oceanobacillus luteolus]|uniref:YusW family protein n=1 Tax=Oceanobacillus luteolus TaxID=1274358 RepID=A0ABW4HRX7_9BACI|nr:YusW family protein [Oceanobacillus luteolus]MCM3739648.1 YusW family protein [Oceanobacillus luteolus]
MKKILMLLTITTLIGILAACGDNDEVTEQPQNNDTATNEETDTTTEENTDNNATDDTNTNDNNDSAATDSNYIFRSFDLEVDIENDDDAIDVDYDDDRDDNEIEASYENKPENINLSGNEAMDELDSIFTAFQFDENSSDEEVLSEVLEAFNIPEDAAKVDLEIEYANGTEKEYRR